MMMLIPDSLFVDLKNENRVYEILDESPCTDMVFERDREKNKERAEKQKKELTDLGEYKIRDYFFGKE
ncbi:hypothetical protein [Methanolapillus millepedarum]|uniref:Uncharacterized protein n=1 Tax=Methanolapillus millepedarum TaxID=3028296 RepID=A0AA96V424_9EURY|nr:hypothetical protein MsAc7_17750 [Methanosarcinaceae archaeon Ac7]